MNRWNAMKLSSFLGLGGAAAKAAAAPPARLQRRDAEWKKRLEPAQ